jgi:hypothetical protein
MPRLALLQHVIPRRRHCPLLTLSNFISNSCPAAFFGCTALDLRMQSAFDCMHALVAGVVAANERRLMSGYCRLIRIYRLGRNFYDRCAIGLMATNRVSQVRA